MNDFFEKKSITPFALLLIGVGLMAVSGAVTCFFLKHPPQQASQTLQQLYKAAVQDAIEAEEDEIEPLVMIDADSELVTWDEAGERVLMLTWHNNAVDGYAEGESTTLSGGPVWTFTDREAIQWYRQNGDSVRDWDLRWKQLLGLPETELCTHVTAMWVAPADLIRPAYQTDIAKPVTAESLKTPSLQEHQAWFDDNIVWAYFDASYPWTRLGYTYDWADNGTEYGLSEFLVLEGSEVRIAWTRTTDAFVGWLAEQAQKTDP